MIPYPHLRRLGVLAALVMFAPNEAASAPKLPYRYVISELGTLSSGFTNDTDHWAINDRGMVLGLHRPLVGSLPPKDGGATVWTDRNGNFLPDPDYADPAGSTTPVRESRFVGVPAGQPGARLMDMNNAGIVAGSLYDGSTSLRAARWSPLNGLWPPDQGSPAILVGAGGQPGMRFNDANVVVDRFARAMWFANGTRFDLAAQFTTDSQGKSLVTMLDFANDDRLLVSTQVLDTDGQLRVYYHLWTRGTPPIKTPFIGGVWGALNARGQYAVRAGVRVEVSPGVFQTRDSIAVRDDVTSTTWFLAPLLTNFDINEHGFLVGWRTKSSPPDTIPYVWDADRGAQDLNQLVESSSVKLTHAVAVNNFGEIVALGNDLSSPGPKKAYLLRPLLGIDRWWATRGTATPLTVHWTARLGEPGDADAEVATQLIMPGAGWTLAADATIEMVSTGTRPGRTLPLAPGIVSRWGTLPTGTYTFRITGLVAPSTAQVGSAAFVSWHGGRMARVEVDLVADHPDPGATFNTELQQYAPILHMQPGDDIGPVGVEATWGPPGAAYDAVPSWCLGAPVTGDIHAQMDLSRFIPTATAANWPLPPTAMPRATTWKVPAPVAVPSVYGTALLSEPELALSYYFHYRRNDWLDHGGYNNHEGDWEGITVFLRRTTPVDPWIPDRIAFSQHVRVAGLGGGEVVPWGAAGTRPHVYVGLGGHASYPTAGVTCIAVASAFDPVRPEYHQAGVLLDPAPVVPLPRVGELQTGPDPWQWLLFPGHWGRVTGSTGGDGPHGPVFIERTLEHFSIAPVGRRWLDPWAWATSLGGPGPELCFLESFETFAGWAVLGTVTWLVGEDEEADDHEVELAGPGDAAIGRSFTISSTGHTNAQFSFRVDAAGPNDRLVLKWGVSEVWSTNAVDALGAGYGQTPLIPLTAFAGQTGNLELRLVAASGTSSRVRIDDLSVSTSTEDPLGVRPETPSGAPSFAWAWPNPFRQTLRLRFSLARPAQVTLRVFDPAGRLLRLVLDRTALAAGERSVEWDGRDQAGHAAAPGLYLVRLNVSGEQPITRRVIRLR